MLTFVEKVVVIPRGEAKFFRLSHDVVTCDVDRHVSTAYCWSSSGDEVGWLCVIL